VRLAGDDGRRYPTHGSLCASNNMRCQVREPAKAHLSAFSPINLKYIRILTARRNSYRAHACERIRAAGSESLSEQGRDITRYLTQRKHSELSRAARNEAESGTWASNRIKAIKQPFPVIIQLFVYTLDTVVLRAGY
jgi:hypothetical protein